MQNTQIRIRSIVALCAVATWLSLDFPALAVTPRPAKLNGVLKTGREIKDFAISGDNNWVVYRADQETNGVLELYSRPIAGSGSPIKMNETLADFEAPQDKKAQLET